MQQMAVTIASASEITKHFQIAFRGMEISMLSSLVRRAGADLHCS